jgi:CBS domain-containing protein
MGVRVRDVMRTDVGTVGSEMSLPDLERAFIDRKRSGFPVVDAGRLVGIVSRSDVVRQLCVEQTLAEQVSDFYAGEGVASVVESFEAIGERVGSRIETLRVRDVMSRRLITVSPDEGLSAVARRLVEHGIHRLPVVEGERLLGLVSSLDLVRLFAEERVSAS